MKKSLFHEINKFSSLNEYQQFSDHVNVQCRKGILREISSSPEFKNFQQQNKRWFKEKNTQYIWLLRELAPPLYGVWEKWEKVG